MPIIESSAEKLARGPRHHHETDDPPTINRSSLNNERHSALNIARLSIFNFSPLGIRNSSLCKLRMTSACEEATTADADRRWWKSQLDTHGQVMTNNTDRKKRSRTIRMLYYWGKFVGIVQLRLSKNNEILFSYRGMLYGFVLSAAYSYLFYHLLADRMKMLLPGETPISVIVDFIGITAGFLEIVLTWVISGIHQNRVKLIVESFARAEKISRELRIPENYDKHFGELGLYLTIVHLLYILWRAFNNWAMARFSNSHVLVWTFYMVPRVNSYSMLILFIWSLAIVRRKFRRLNDRVRFVMRNHMTAGLLRRSSWNGTHHLDKIDAISQLHRELRDLTCRISGHFALIILLNIVTDFTNLAINVHVLYLVLKFSGPLKGTVYPVLVVCWILIPVIVLAVISNVCGSTVDEANETGNILHSVINNCEHLLNLQAATVRCSNFQRFQLVSLDLLQNQVKISLFGFLDLNAFCMYSVIATATTHIMIMLQFYN